MPGRCGRDKEESVEGPYLSRGTPIRRPRRGMGDTMSADFGVTARDPAGGHGRVRGVPDRLASPAPLGAVADDVHDPGADALAHIPAAVYVATPDELWTPVWISDQIAAVTGFTPDELVDDPALWVSQVHPDDRERLLIDRRRAVGESRPLRAEYRVRGRDGEVRWIHDEASVRPVEDGRVEVHGILLDVTERRKSGDVLDALYESARENARELRAAGEARSAFLQLLVHDIKHPLAESLELIGDLQASPDGAAVDGPLGRVASSLERAHDLLTNVLNLERLDAREPALQPAPSRLSGLVAEVIDDLGGAASAVAVDVEPAVVVVDPLVVRQGLTKLVQNALVHTPPGTTVQVRGTRRADGGVHLTVSDDGPGVPDVCKREIFEPFARGQAPASRPGLGLGLAVVARLAGVHGGRAWVEDGSDGGAVFHLLLAQLG